MGITGSPDIFQENMSGLMGDLEFVRTYLDDLLILTKSSFDEHIQKLDKVLNRLKSAGLHINADKSTFAANNIEYLGYLLTREGIRPVLKKVQAMLDLSPPSNVKELCRVLGVIQYYRDFWGKRSHLLTPLADLV